MHAQRARPASPSTSASRTSAHRLVGERTPRLQARRARRGSWARPLGAAPLSRLRRRFLRVVRGEAFGAAHDRSRRRAPRAAGLADGPLRARRSDLAATAPRRRPYRTFQLVDRRGRSRGYAVVRVVGDRALLVDLQAEDEARRIADLLDAVADVLDGTRARPRGWSSAPASALAPRGALAAELGFAATASDTHLEVRAVDARLRPRASAPASTTASSITTSSSLRKIASSRSRTRSSEKVARDLEAPARRSRQSPGSSRRRAASRAIAGGVARRARARHGFAGERREGRDVREDDGDARRHRLERRERESLRVERRVQEEVEAVVPRRHRRRGQRVRVHVGRAGSPARPRRGQRARAMQAHVAPARPERATARRATSIPSAAPRTGPTTPTIGGLRGRVALRVRAARSPPRRIACGRTWNGPGYRPSRTRGGAPR